MKDLSKILATCFFIGYIPLFPGTIASIVAMLIHFFLSPSIFIQFIALNIIFLAGAVVSEQTGPSHIVIDKWFGMWLALFLAPPRFWIYMLALVTFRFISLLKPISHIKKNVPGGLGTMLDDACAGFFTFILIQLTALFLFP